MKILMEFCHLHLLGVGVVDSDEKDMLTHHSEPEVASTEKET